MPPQPEDRTSRAVTPSSVKNRLTSIDLLRGITMVVMTLAAFLLDMIAFHNPPDNVNLLCPASSDGCGRSFTSRV